MAAMSAGADVSLEAMLRDFDAELVAVPDEDPERRELRDALGV